LVYERDYPYTGKVSMCQKKVGAFKLKNFEVILPRKADACLDLMWAVKSKGPVAVAVDASGWAAYRSGVFSNCTSFDSGTVNHGVAIYGYTSSENWILKNSWGTTWG
jgi:C1A family cysteine protease